MAMSAETVTMFDRVLQLLADGEWHTEEEPELSPCYTS